MKKMFRLPMPRAVVALALTLPVLAQTQEPERLKEVIVTGSNIPTVENATEAGPNPVLVISRDKIEKSGNHNLADILKNLTVTSAGGTPISNNATGFTPGASSISLRGLGPDSTLVLINGRRVASYPTGDGGTTSFVDLNTIPASAIERVDVLKDGAAAIYGADAVAGVVNIVTRKNFNGAEANFYYGNTTNRNADRTSGSLIFGSTTEKTSITALFNYDNEGSVANRDRSYSAVPPFLSTNSSPGNFSVPFGAIQAAQGVPVDPATANDKKFASPVNFNAVNDGNLPVSAYTISDGRTSRFNFNQFSLAYPSKESLGGLFSAEHKIYEDAVQTYGDVQYQRTDTHNELAPTATGNFAAKGQVTIVIPARTASPDANGDGVADSTRLASAGAYNPFNPFNADISGGTRLRLADFGNRLIDRSTQAFLASGGFKGERIYDKYNYDVNFTYSQVREEDSDRLQSASRFNRILNQNDSIFDPNSSDYIGTTTAYNPFGYYKNPIASNKATIDYVTLLVKAINVSEAYTGEANINTTDLFSLPGGSVGASIGAQYRFESLNQNPDAYSIAGDIIGNSRASITSASRDAYAIYSEMQVPIIGNDFTVPGIHSLIFSPAARYEEFFYNNTNVLVPKLAIRWQPFDETLTIRSTWSKGFRQPSLYQLYAGSTSGLETTNLPDGTNIDPELTTITTSNAKLHPEHSESINVGAVWTPNYELLKGFSFAADAWKIERSGVVLAPSNDDIVASAIANKPIAGAVLYDAAGAVLPAGLTANQYLNQLASITKPFINSGKYIVQGIDLGASYEYPSEKVGVFTYAVNSTYLDSYKYATAPNQPLVQYVTYGKDASSNEGYYQWKMNATFDWAFKGFEWTNTLNFNNGFKEQDADGNYRYVDAYTTMDMNLAYTFGKSAGGGVSSKEMSQKAASTLAVARPFVWYADTKLSLGIKNLWDAYPPYASGQGGNASGYPAYDDTSVGQFFYMSVNKKF